MNGFNSLRSYLAVRKLVNYEEKICVEQLDHEQVDSELKEKITNIAHQEKRNSVDLNSQFQAIIKPIKKIEFAANLVSRKRIIINDTASSLDTYSKENLKDNSKNDGKIEAEIEESIDAQQITVNNIDVSEELLLQVEEYTNTICQVQKLALQNKFRIRDCQSDHAEIFWFEDLPSLIFKTFKESAIDLDESKKLFENRIDNTEKCRRIISDNKFNLLFVPQSKVYMCKSINFKEKKILVEQKVDFLSSEESYEIYGKTMNKTIKQFAKFIALTGYSDVEYRNNPVLINKDNTDEAIQIALIDLEHLGSAKIGLFGTHNKRRTGLYRLCKNREHKNIIERVAKKYKVKKPDSSIRLMMLLNRR